MMLDEMRCQTSGACRRLLAKVSSTGLDGSHVRVEVKSSGCRGCAPSETQVDSDGLHPVDVHDARRWMSYRCEGQSCYAPGTRTPQLLFRASSTGLTGSTEHAHVQVLCPRCKHLQTVTLRSVAGLRG